MEQALECCFSSMVPRPAASAPLGDLLEMLIGTLHPRPTESETLELKPGI